jgi:hypothetical protein
MNDMMTRPSLDLVRQALAARSERCAICGRRVQSQAPNVRLRGDWFHAHCAGYRSQRDRAA